MEYANIAKRICSTEYMDSSDTLTISFFDSCNKFTVQRANRITYVFARIVTECSLKNTKTKNFNKLISSVFECLLVDTWHTVYSKASKKYGLNRRNKQQPIYAASHCQNLLFYKCSD